MMYFNLDEVELRIESEFDWCNVDVVLSSVHMDEGIIRVRVLIDDMVYMTPWVTSLDELVDVIENQILLGVYCVSSIQ